MMDTSKKFIIFIKYLHFADIFFIFYDFKLKFGTYHQCEISSAVPFNKLRPTIVTNVMNTFLKMSALL